MWLLNFHVKLAAVMMRCLTVIRYRMRLFRAGRERVSERFPAFFLVLWLQEVVLDVDLTFRSQRRDRKRRKEKERKILSLFSLIFWRMFLPRTWLHHTFSCLLYFLLTELFVQSKQELLPSSFSLAYCTDSCHRNSCSCHVSVYLRMQRSKKTDKKFLWQHRFFWRTQLILFLCQDNRCWDVNVEDDGSISRKYYT